MGDYNKDRADDLVILGSGSYDTAGVYGRAGYVSGSRGGWADHQELSRGGPVGASGDVDKDGYDEVAIGAPGNDVGAAADAGTVWVLRGAPRRD